MNKKFIMADQSKGFMRFFLPFTISFQKKNDERSIISQLNILYPVSVLLIIGLFAMRTGKWFEFWVFFVSIVILYIYGKSGFVRLTWSKHGISGQDKLAWPGPILILFPLPRQSIDWSEITEINIADPTRRLSIYAGKKNVVLELSTEVAATPTEAKRIERSVLAFARYAKLRLRNKPGIIWST